MAEATVALRARRARSRGRPTGRVAADRQAARRCRWRGRCAADRGCCCWTSRRPGLRAAERERLAQLLETLRPRVCRCCWSSTTSRSSRRLAGRITVMDRGQRDRRRRAGRGCAAIRVVIGAYLGQERVDARA